MENKKEMTAPNVSVGADTKQSIQKCTGNSITDYVENIKYFEEMQRELMISLDPSYLKTISMSELYDTMVELGRKYPDRGYGEHLSETFTV